MTDNLLSVLVVDDELPIRQELRLVDWESCEAVLVGEAENGREALDFCNDYVPDIILTDITMPIIDGLTLFQKIKKLHPKTQFIILTCHSDFGYAQKAIKLGAIDYITKIMLDENDLRESLQRAREKIQLIEFKEHNELQQLQYKHSKILRKIIDNPSDNVLIEDLFSSLNTNQIAINFPLRIIRLVSKVNYQERLFVNQEIQKVLDKMKQFLSCIPIEAGEYLLIINNQSNIEYIKSELKSIIDILLINYKKHLTDLNEQSQIYGVISQVINNQTDFITEVIKSSKWENKMFYCLDNRIFIGEPPMVYFLSEQEIKSVHDKFKKCNWELNKLNNFFKHELYSDLKNKLVNQLQVKNLLIDLYGQLKKVYKDNNYPVMIQRIMRTDSFKDTISIILGYLNAHYETDIYRPEIRKAKQFILDNYSKQINLNITSKEVGLTPNYLSKLFFEEVGESFADMLTRLRMEKAIELLKNTDLKIYQIAENIGIISYRYFTIVFRNFTGVTPTQYRKGEYE